MTATSHLAPPTRLERVTVYGFGERETNTTFVATYDEFMYVDALNVEPEDLLVTPQSPMTNARPALVRTQQAMRPFDTAAIRRLAITVINAPKLQ